MVTPYRQPASRPSQAQGPARRGSTLDLVALILAVIGGAALVSMFVSFMVMVIRHPQNEAIEARNAAIASKPLVMDAGAAGRTTPRPDVRFSQQTISVGPQPIKTP
jgi:hypothetical protein